MKFLSLILSWRVFNIYSKFVYVILKLKGIINFGGKSQSVFKFVKKYNPKIKKISYKKVFGKTYPSNTSMNLKKFKRI